MYSKPFQCRQCGIFVWVQNLVSYVKRITQSEVDNKMLRNVFEPNRDEVTEDWWKFHNEKPAMCGLH